jgi:hypothetical protein
MQRASIADWLTGIGTLAVAVVAVWGAELKAWLHPPKAAIEVQNLLGEYTHFGDNRPVVFYHLKVVSRRRFAPLRNCRVLLAALWRRSKAGRFEPAPMPVPFQLAWAPSESTPALMTIQSEQPFDLGFLRSPTTEEVGRFQPALYHLPFDFRGFVLAGEAVRYALRVEADGMVDGHTRLVQISWDGQWSDDLGQLATHLSVKLLAA